MWRPSTADFRARMLRVRQLMRIRATVCRECREAVGAWEEICPRCGASGPARVPAWICYTLVGLIVWNLLLLMV